MKIKITNIYIMVIIFLLFASCSSEKEEESIDPYLKEIFVWFSNNQNIYENIMSQYKPDGNSYYIYYNDELTCQACKLNILGLVSEYPNIYVLTNFDNQKQEKFFRTAYGMENMIIDGMHEPRKSLVVPFLFQMDKKRIYNIFVLEDGNFRKKDFEKYFRITKKESIVKF